MDDSALNAALDAFEMRYPAKGWRNPQTVHLLRIAMVSLYESGVPIGKLVEATASVLRAVALEFV